jgi:hypothetical protein
MPSRTISIEGAPWTVFPAGRITPNHRDEFALVFVQGEGDARRVRVTRYSPRGARARDASLAELSETDLQRFFAMSQPAATSPEAGYLR